MFLFVCLFVFFSSTSHDTAWPLHFKFAFYGYFFSSTSHDTAWPLHFKFAFYGYEDHVLDASITAEEAGLAVKKLKRRKDPGPDNLMAEHLIEGVMLLPHG